MVLADYSNSPPSAKYASIAARSTPAPPGFTGGISLQRKRLSPFPPRCAFAFYTLPTLGLSAEAVRLAKSLDNYIMHYSQNKCNEFCVNLSLLLIRQSVFLEISFASHPSFSAKTAASINASNSFSSTEKPFSRRNSSTCAFFSSPRPDPA